MNSGVSYLWRAEFSSAEANRLHAEAFSTRLFTDSEWDWRTLVERHSLGWVTARAGADLIGFVNVVWDGQVHAWIQDVMVGVSARHQSVGSGLVRAAQLGTQNAGCEWLHVDFDAELSAFYFDACGFRPTTAGLIHLSNAAPAS